MTDRLTVAVAAALCGAGCSLIVDPGGLVFEDEDAAVDGGTSDAHVSDASPLPDGSRDAGREDEDAGAAGLPDLVVSCPTPADILGEGATVRVPWTATNVGSGRAEPLLVSLLLERPAMTAGESPRFVEMATERSPTALSADEMGTGELVFVAPDWVRGGPNPLRCVVDAMEEIEELDEANNDDDASLIVLALPDLRITALTSTYNVSRSEVDYRFQIDNIGGSAASDIGWAVQTNAGSSASGSLLFLGPGDSQVISGSMASDPPSVTQAFVDPSDEIREVDETNNSAMR